MSSMLNKVISSILLGMCILCFSGSATAQEKKTYQVKKGDTFYSISKALDVTVAELKEWNGISSNTLEIDQ